GLHDLSSTLGLGSLSVADLGTAARWICCPDDSFRQAGTKFLRNFSVDVPRPLCRTASDLRLWARGRHVLVSPHLSHRERHFGPGVCGTNSGGGASPLRGSKGPRHLYCAAFAHSFSS